MSIVKLSIAQKSFENTLAEEMKQQVIYCGEKMPFFAYVLRSSVCGFQSYKDWELIEGYYVCEVDFWYSMVLKDLKKLTTSNEILRDCEVEIYQQTTKKRGYYQVTDGMTKAGYSIVPKPFMLAKLADDYKQVQGVDRKIKISMNEDFESNPYSANIVNQQRNTQPRKIYSLFINRQDYIKENMDLSIQTLVKTLSNEGLAT